MRQVFSLRHPVMACLLLPLGLGLTIGMIGCPAFQPHGMVQPKAGLDKHPLEALQLPDLLRAALPKSVWRAMSDDQGFTYGASASLTGPIWQGSAMAKDLNAALAYMEEASHPFALKRLGRHFDVYPPMVLGRQSAGTDEMPKTRKSLVAYGLIRYNRAVVLLRMANGLDRRDQKRGQFLRRACYDLRRSVGAFERLGKLDAYAGEPYWGQDVNAWDGFGLEASDSGLPIHQVYANLAIAYFRLADSQGYPDIALSYMAREDRKYMTGQSQFSAVVSLLIQSCLQGEAPSLRKFRLTMALQNLEAAGRGMASAGEIRFNYTIGLILAELYRLDEGVVPEHAVGFLALAARGKSHSRESAAAMAAQKELALIYLELERDKRFLASIADLVPTSIRGSQASVGNTKKLAFADVALYGHLRRGEWEIAANHIQFRQDELVGRLADSQTMKQHEALISAVCEASMLALKKRLRQQWHQTGAEQVIGYLIGLHQDAWLSGDDAMARNFQQRTWRGLIIYPDIGMSLWLTNRPFLRVAFQILPWLFLAGLILYSYWFWRSHRRIATQRLQSGYAQDIHET